MKYCVHDLGLRPSSAIYKLNDLRKYFNVTWIVFLILEWRWNLTSEMKQKQLLKHCTKTYMPETFSSEVKASVTFLFAISN